MKSKGMKKIHRLSNTNQKMAGGAVLVQTEHTSHQEKSPGRKKEIHNDKGVNLPR